MPDIDRDEPVNEPWQKEVLADHRWGPHGNGRASEELTSLRKLWHAVQPLNKSCRKIVDQIIALEICNWNLEGNFLALCRAIGSKEPVQFPTGHLASVSDERWKKVWAYYLTLCNWLPREGTSSYETLLKTCDPDSAIQSRVLSLLGERNELKELYVERFCLCLEFWLRGFSLLLKNSAQMRAHVAAASTVEEEIKKRDPNSRILDAMKGDGNGWLQPCSHKAFPRYDSILSSIGAGEWPGWTLPPITNRLQRIGSLEDCLAAIETWIDGQREPAKALAGECGAGIHAALGKPDPVKLFLASLLVSLLRAQILTAKSNLMKRAKREQGKV